MFSCCDNIYGLEQVLKHLAHKENTHSEPFLLGRLKIVIIFCSLTALIDIRCHLTWLKY